MTTSQDAARAPDRGNLVRAGRVLWAVSTTSLGVACASAVLALTLADAPGELPKSRDRARLAQIIGTDDTVTGAIGKTVIDPCTGAAKR